MMGKALDEPRCTGMQRFSGLLPASEKELCRAELQPCIRCAKCVSACPDGARTLFVGHAASALRQLGSWSV